MMLTLEPQIHQTGELNFVLIEERLVQVMRDQQSEPIMMIICLSWRRW